MISRLQKQPNKWSCIPTSLAMLVDRPVSEIIPLFGHDGSEYVHENPFQRRCFYDVEAVRVAYDLGVHLVPFVRYLGIQEDRQLTLIDDPTFVRLLECHSGLLMGITLATGIGHSVAWIDRHVLCPRSPELLSYEQLYVRQNVEVLYAWVNRPNRN